jgi:segregation and condensation protein B
MLYGTSKRFLEVFGLKALKDLPELRELEELAREHGLGGPGQDDEAEGSALDAPITEIAEGEGPDAAAVAADLGVKEIDPAGLAPEAEDAETGDDAEVEIGEAGEAIEVGESDEEERVIDLDAAHDGDEGDVPEAAAPDDEERPA